MVNRESLLILHGRTSLGRNGPLILNPERTRELRSDCDFGEAVGPVIGGQSAPGYNPGVAARAFLDPARP
jgi:hypothetical protein